MPCPRFLRRSSPLLAAAALLLAGCAQSAPSSPQSEADLAACRHHVDNVLLQQNRNEFYQPDNTGTPFAGGGLSGVTDSRLPLQYQRSRMISDCANHRNVHPANRGSLQPFPAHP